MDLARHPPTAFKGDTFEIVRHPGSSKLILFFSATGTGPGKFNYWNDGNKLECHRMFLNNGPNEWYQAGVLGFGVTIEDTIRTIRQWTAFLGATDIYTCGASMGGYAAMLYGILLEARVLAFCGETPLMVPHSRSAKLIRRGTKILYPDLSKLIPSAKKPIVAYYGELDPVDIFCASTIRNLPNVRLTTFRHIEHGPPRYLRDNGLLLDYLNLFLSHEHLPPTQADGRMLEYEGFAPLYLATFQAFKDRAWDRVVVIGKQALTLYPTSELCQLLIGLAYAQLNCGPQALYHLAMATTLHPSDVEYKFRFANMLRHFGFYPEAIDLFQEILKAHPSHVNSQHYLGIALKKMRASEAYRKAAELYPSNMKLDKKPEGNWWQTLVNKPAGMPQPSAAERRMTGTR